MATRISDHIQSLVKNATTFLIDLDGTLVDSSLSVTRAWTAWSKRHGVNVDDVFAISEGRQGHAVVAELRPDLDAITEDQWLIDHQLNDTADVVEIPGARSFLAGLQYQQWAIVTSCPSRLAYARLAAAELPMPVHMICADDVQRSKPHPDGFLMAMARLRVTPEECIVFEDSEAGLESAKLAGVTTIAIHHAARTKPQGARIAIENWWSLNCIAINAPASKAAVG